jgi:hypothetical protein
MTASIVQRLREAAAALPAERVSMQTIAQAHRPAAHGAMLLLMGSTLPPAGAGAGRGHGAWSGNGRAGDCDVEGPFRGMPSAAGGRLELSRQWAQRVLGLLASAYAMAGRYARARLSHRASADRRSWTAGAVGLMAVIVVLPIAFGNVLPARAMMLIGLGLVFRDGVAVVLGLTTAGVALLVTAGLVLMAWVWGSEWITRWVSM